jgi:hypothetical protein
MTLRLLPGASPADAAQELQRQVNEATNVLAVAHTSEDILGGYLRWAIEAELMLRNHFTAATVAAVIFTDRYWSLQTPAPASRDLIPLLVNAEVREQTTRLAAERDRLVQSQTRWQKGRLVLLDTSAVIQGPTLWEWDPAATLGLRDNPVLIVIPVLVLDELDELKESTKQHTRHRARTTLRWLAEQLGSSPSTRVREGTIERTNGLVTNVRGVVYLDVLLDDPGHRRLPIADDEIVDRATLIAAEAGRTVIFITNDVAQAYRARLAGLTVVPVADLVYDVDLQEAAREIKRQQKDQQRNRARNSGLSQSPNPDRDVEVGQ